MSQDKKYTPQDAVKLRDRELDDFWDVERLLPNQPKTPKYTPTVPRKTPEAVDIEVPPVGQRAARPEIRTVTVPPTGSSPLSFSHEEKAVTEGVSAEQIDRNAREGARGTAEQKLLDEYIPDSNLLHRVRVYEWHSNYHYFDQFTKDAASYAVMSGREASPEPFFSYFPQYAQLNRRQRAWYLFWRDRVRAGDYPKTDYAYILLYLFELINLPTTGEEAEQNRDLLAKVWVAYRKTYPQLDHYACEWLCDYCLIHRLNAPVLHLLPALSQIIAMARLKEFYLSAMISVGNEQVNVASAKILLAHSCQYDYRKSKFYSGEHKELFDRVIPRAVAAVFPWLLAQGSPSAQKHPEGSFMQDSTVSRDAYVGALCAYGNKRRIELSYTSFSRSHDLRFTLGDMVRHIENRIRGSVLIRSRLTTHSLTPSLRKVLDAWLDEHLPSPKIAQRKAEESLPRPEYEALYDLPHTEVSIESADEIERSSWETTRILVDAFSEETREPLNAQELKREAPPVLEAKEPEPAPIPEPVPESPSQSESVPDHPLLTALGDRADFVRAVLCGDRAGQKAYCTAHKKLPDAVVDEINDLAVAHEIFDMIIEDDGRGGLQVIEDYRETVGEIMDT